MRVGTMLGLGLGVAAALAGCGTAASDPGRDLEAYAAELFDLANAEREAAGLSPVAWDECLAAKAAERAAPLAGDGPLQHELLVASCLDDAMAGENLSRIDASPATVVDAWMGSAGHRANIVEPAFTAGAVACVEAGSGDGEGAVACSFLYEG